MAKLVRTYTKKVAAAYRHETNMPPNAFVLVPKRSGRDGRADQADQADQADARPTATRYVQPHPYNCRPTTRDGVCQPRPPAGGDGGDGRRRLRRLGRGGDDGYDDLHTVRLGTRPLGLEIVTTPEGAIRVQAI